MASFIATLFARNSLISRGYFLYSGAFDRQFYLSRYPEAASYPGGPLRHYVDVGVGKGYSPHPLFDPNFFRRRYPALAARLPSPYMHFLLSGAKEQLSPCALFDTNYYFAMNDDVRSSGVNPLLHYLRWGVLERRDPNPFFSTNYYLDRYPEVARSGINPLIHYALLGAAEGRDPCELFSSAGYLRRHSDIAKAGMNPLVHYLQFGRAEGRSIVAPATYARAAAKDVAATGKKGRDTRPAQRPAFAAMRKAATLPKRKPMISIIILNRSGEKLLDALFRSFLATNKYQKYEFIVVDHASTDGSLDLISRWAEILPINVIPCDQNYTFSYSNNRAAEQASGELLLLLNNDVVFSEDVLGRMVAALEGDAIGAVGIKQYLGSPGGLDAPSLHHIGIRFGWADAGRFMQPRNLRESALDELLAESVSTFPAVTAAMLLCRARDYSRVGGLDEGYKYGYEDVDFCLKLRLGLGLDVVSVNNAHVFHNESTTRDKVPSTSRREERLANRERLKRRFGYQIRREFTRKLLDDDGSFTGRQLKVAIAVTTLDASSGAGDLYTAFGLGDALRKAFGWEVRYLPKGRWYEAEDVDVYIAMRDDVDIRKLVTDQPHLITIAWLRNWLERWAVHPWTELFDIHLCSSQLGVDYMWDQCRLHCHLFPIAVDLSLFNIGPEKPEYATDCVFTGNYWEADVQREIESLNPASICGNFSVYGKNWMKHSGFAPYHKGFLEYRNLPEVYNSAKITIDDTVTHVTKLWGSLNSRVFEALASGSLVLTNNALGSAELFDDELPVWDDAAELTTLVSHYLDNPQERASKVKSLRAKVIGQHSYEERAKSLKSILSHTVDGLRIAIKCPVPRQEEAEAWGDYHFARSLRRALVRQGHRVRIDLLPEWHKGAALADDAVIVLRGLSAYEVSADQINICWMISHPDAVSDAELESYDHVFVASTSYAAELAKRLKVPVSPLLQCSDPEVFHPPMDALPALTEDLLFVGNSRRQMRTIIRDCLAKELPVAIHGRDWQGLVPSEKLRGEHIANTALHAHYASAKIVLNDHWPDMARLGFISNRIFDVALSGGFVISDQFVGSEIFDAAVVTYDNADHLAELCRQWCADDSGRREMAARLRQQALLCHTFDHRVAEILDVIGACHQARTTLIPGMESHHPEPSLTVSA